MTIEVRCVIPGHPAPKGSLKCVGGRGRHQLVEDNARTSEWRDHVAGLLRRNWPADRRAAPHQAIGVDLTFTMPRPAGHYGTGRNARTLKPSAPLWPTTRATYDVDKLVRLLLDAGQDAGVLADDAAVVDLTTAKRYVDSTGPAAHPDALGFPGVVIRLYPQE